MYLELNAVDNSCEAILEQIADVLEKAGLSGKILVKAHIKYQMDDEDRIENVNLILMGPFEVEKKIFTGKNSIFSFMIRTTQSKPNEIQPNYGNQEKIKISMRCGSAKSKSSNWGTYLFMECDFDPQYGESNLILSEKLVS